MNDWYCGVLCRKLNHLLIVDSINLGQTACSDGSTMSRVRDALKRADSWQPEQNALPVQPLPRVIPVAEASGDEPEERVADTSSTLERVVRQLMRWLGMRPTGTPVPRCAGLTRKGAPCRAPAMANGYCRMHGGSRQGKLRRAAQALQAVNR
jgi:hypothetical protein